MPYKDPAKRRQHDRERRRAERAGAAAEVEGTQINLSTPLSERPTVSAVVEILAQEINQVRTASVETLARARTVSLLAGTLLKALEVGSIEERLAALEAKLMSKEGGKP